MLKEALEVIRVAVADRDCPVRRTGQVERLPRYLKIKKPEGEIIRGGPQGERVPAREPVPDVRHRLRISRKRPSCPATDDGGSHGHELSIDADDRHRESDL